MSSDLLLSRIAVAALCVALTATTATAQSAQTARRFSPTTARSFGKLPAPSPLTPADPAPPLEPLPAATAGPRAGSGPETLTVSGAANYGAPRRPQRLPKPYPPRRVSAPAPFAPPNALPPLEPYKSSAVARRQARARLDPLAPRYPPPPTVAVEPTIKVKPRPRVEQNPYDPIGIGIGSLRLFPYVQASGGYDDNPNRLPGNVVDKRPSALFRGEGGFDLKSDWDRHAVTAKLRGGYTEYFNYSAASRPDANGEFVGRYDITRDTQLDLKSRVTLDTIRPNSPAVNQGVLTGTVLDRPITLALNVSPGVTQRFNRLEVSLRGTYDRVIYNDVPSSDGTTLDLSRTSYNGYGGGGRVSYELSPDLKPFVEGTADRRVHDSPTDFNGYFRDNSGYNIRGGAQVNFSEVVKGEASGGYAERSYDDPRLTRLRGPTIDASLIWTPSALTTVTLRGSSTLNETTLAQAAGVFTRSVSAQLSHDLLRNLNVSVLGSYFDNQYQGTTINEYGYTAGVKLDYKITRTVSLRGSYIHERLSTNYPNSDYTANVFLVGLRFQP